MLASGLAQHNGLRLSLVLVSALSLGVTGSTPCGPNDEAGVWRHTAQPKTLDAGDDYYTMLRSGVKAAFGLVKYHRFFASDVRLQQMAYSEETSCSLPSIFTAKQLKLGRRSSIWMLGDSTMSHAAVALKAILAHEDVTINYARFRCLPDSFEGLDGYFSELGVLAPAWNEKHTRPSKWKHKLAEGVLIVNFGIWYNVEYESDLLGCTVPQLARSTMKHCSMGTSDWARQALAALTVRNVTCSDAAHVHAQTTPNDDARSCEICEVKRSLGVLTPARYLHDVTLFARWLDARSDRLPKRVLWAESIPQHCECFGTFLADEAVAAVCPSASPTAKNSSHASESASRRLGVGEVLGEQLMTWRNKLAEPAIAALAPRVQIHRSYARARRFPKCDDTSRDSPGSCFRYVSRPPRVDSRGNTLARDMSQAALASWPGPDVRDRDLLTSRLHALSSVGVPGGDCTHYSWDTAAWRHHVLHLLSSVLT